MIRFPISPNVAADLVPLFREGLRASRVKAGEFAVIYADALTHPQYPAAFMAAAKDLGAEVFQIIQPVVPLDLGKGVGRAVPSRLITETLKQADFVVDITTGGMLYSNEQNAILSSGTRVLRVREPDDCLLRLLPSDDVRSRSKRGGDRLDKAKHVRITSEYGTDLRMDKSGRPVSIQYSMADEIGRWDHWPTGLVNSTAIEESVEGTLVLSPGSIVFPFDRYVTEPVTLHFKEGVVDVIEGGREAIMLNDLLEARNDRNCRRLAHLGWGTDRRARWDVLSSRGADGGGGAEARSIYAGVLLALGENRDLGGDNGAPLHIDLALRRAGMELDGVPVVENGRFLDEALA